MGLRVVVRVMSTQKRPKNPYARVLVLCQVPLETIMRVNNFGQLFQLEAPICTSLRFL